MKTTIAGKMRKALAWGFALVLGLAATSANADVVTNYWKGGSTQFLAHPSNWKNSICPGRVYDANFDPPVTNGTWGGVMIFDGDVEGTWPQDLRTGTYAKRNLLSTGKMIFRRNKVQHTSYAWNDWLIESGGGIYVEESVGANVPYEVANSGINFVKAPGDDLTVTFRNDSTNAPLKFMNVNNAASRWTAATGPELHIEGKGTVEFCTTVWTDQDKSITLVPATDNGGKTVFSGTSSQNLGFLRWWIPASDAKRVVELPNGAYPFCRLFGSTSRPLIVESDAEFTGTGKFGFSKFNQNANVQIAAGKTLTWGVGVENQDGRSQALCVYGGGTLAFTSAAYNNMTGKVIVYEDSTLATPSIGMAGAASPLGSGSAVEVSDGTFAYTGAGETTDRTLAVKTGGGALAHLGSGTLSFGAVTVAADAEIVVTNDATLVLASLTRTAGTVNVTLRDGAAFKVTGLAAGKAPSWMFVNGLPGRVDAAGQLASVEGADVEIDARGGQIPNQPNAVVAITTATGETDGVTLAESPAAVYVLTQDQNVQPATVKVAEGQSLKTDFVRIVDGAKPLAVEGAGEFAVDGRFYGETFTRSNADTSVKLDMTEASTGIALSGNLTDAAPFKMTEKDSTIALTTTGHVPVKNLVVENGDLALDGASLYEPDAAANFSDAMYQPPLALAIGTNALAKAATVTFDGGSFTGRVAIGMGVSGSRPAGALYQTGGEIVNVWRGEKADYENNGVAGYAYFGLKGGRLVQTGDWYLGGNGGESVMDIRGGSVFHTPTSQRRSYFRFGGWNTRAVLYVAEGGTFDASVMADWTVMMPSFNRQNSNCELTIGADGYVDFGEKNVCLSHAQYNDSYRHYIINLNGGTFRANYVFRARGEVQPSEEFPEGTGGSDRANSYGFVNANGGTYKVKFNEPLFGSLKVISNDGVVSDKASDSYPVTRVTAFEKGLTIDTSAVWSSLGIGGAVQAPYGKGIVSIPWDAEADGKGYVGAPVVMIEGDGMGASAFALFDAATRTVTNVIVTSHGNGYTWAKANITYQRKTVKTIDCELADNVSGGLTVVGAGNLLICGTNTYTGATTIRGKGTRIKLMADDVISSESTLFLDGGELIANGRHQVFASYETANGGFVSGGSITLSGLKTDLDQALAGNVAEGDFLNGVVVPEGATVKIANYDASKLEGLESVLLYKFKYGRAPTTQFVLDPSVTLPAGWALRQTSAGVSIKKVHGTTVIIW